MFRENEIEITFDVRIEAGVGFKVDRDEWNKTTDDEKRAMIGRVIDAAATMFANDVMSIRGTESGFVSAEIIGPADHEIDLTQARIYDPEG